MTPGEKRKQLWDTMLTAELNEQYWVDAARLYGRWDRFLKVVTALLGASTVTTLLTTKSSLGWIPSLVAAILTLCAAVQTIWLAPERLAGATKLAQTWARLSAEYCLLSAELGGAAEVPDSIWLRYVAAFKEQKQIDETAYGVNRRRQKKMIKEIENRRTSAREGTEKEPATQPTDKATAPIAPCQ